MRAAPSSESLATPLTVRRFIDSVCLRFHADWQAGRRPRLDNALGALPEPSRSQLLRALLAIELEQRVRLGERPAEDDYLARFPEAASILGELLAEARHAVLPSPLGGEGLGVRGRAVGETPYDPSATPPPVEPRSALGEYEVLERLGQGGMGVVYKARHKGDGRLVALKLVRADRLAALPAEQRRPWLDRFRAEALATARLEHAHILPVHDVGLHGDRPYYAMRLVEGRSLADRLRHGPLPDREAAACLERVARAVHHAHQVGILHRDLKPGNILLDADGRPFVADFGVAKWADGPHSATQTGLFLGSPPYAAPEQVRDAARATPASDVYGLGATLYHALTGRPPFQAATVAETLRQVEHNDLVPPRLLNPALPPDLENVCLQCLSRDAARRYPSAAALADDLARFLDGRPVEARPAPARERLSRWVRRSPVAVAALVALAAVALCSGLVAAGAVRARGRAAAAASEAVARAEAAETSVGEIKSDLVRSHAAAGQLALARGAWREALRSFDRATDGGPEVRLGRARACKALGQVREARDELARLADEPGLGEKAGLIDLYRGELLPGGDVSAEKLIRTALARGLPPAERLYAQGLVEAKTSAEALAFFRHAVEQDPFHEEARTQAALLLFLLGRRDEANEFLTHSEALFPEALGFPVVRFVMEVFDGAGAAADRRQATLKERVRLGDLEALRAGLEAARPLLEALAMEPAGDQAARLVPPLMRAQRLAVSRTASAGVELSHVLRLPPFLAPLWASGGTDLLPVPLGAPVTKEAVARAARLAEVHPEGTLACAHARLALAYAEQHRPGTGQDDRTYTDLLRSAASAYEAAARRPALLPVKLPALEKLIHVETLLGAPERARPDPGQRTRAATHLRERLALAPSVTAADTFEVFWTTAANAGEPALARQVTAEWERHHPDDARLPRCRAYTEFHAGAYGPAARAARQALATRPDDPVMKRLLTQALDRHRAELAP